MREMKLYVWKDVLRDYSAGMIVALAPNLETALTLTDDIFARSDIGRYTPEVVTVTTDAEPKFWCVHGGS